MMFHGMYSVLKRCGLALAFLMVISNCVDPVQPELEYKQGLIYIDALLYTTPGAYSVKISVAEREFGLNNSPFDPG